MLGEKIDAQKLMLENNANKVHLSSMIKTLAKLILVGVFLWPTSACIMTKAQGEVLTFQVRELEDEVAKLQRVRHDMEVLIVGKVSDIFDRLARLEGQLTSLRESLYEGSSKNVELVAELQNLRNELDLTKNQYRDLENDQKSLAKNQIALKAAQEKIRVPEFKDDHFALGKKHYLGGKFESSVFLLENFIKEYPNDRELVGQSYYLLGEIYRKLAANEKSKDSANNYWKKSVVSYQKIVEKYKASVLREESLYKMGLVLKEMGNKKGAKAAFNELLTQNKKSKRAGEAKRHLASLK